MSSLMEKYRFTIGAIFLATVCLVVDGEPAAAQLRAALPLSPGLAVDSRPAPAQPNTTLAQASPSAAKIREQQTRERINKGVINLITGGIEYASNTYGLLAGDLAAVLDRDNQLRVLPVMGYGAVRNIEDMLYLRGIDIGMMHSDILKFLDLEGQYPQARKRLRLIAKLYDEPFHVIARKDIRSLGELKGKPVVIGQPGSGADASVRTVIRLLDLKVKPINATWKEAIKKMKTGEIAAMIYPTRPPSKYIRSLNGDKSLHLLAMSPNKKTADTYTLLTFTNEHYPNFLQPGETVTTLNLATILAVFNWSNRGTRYAQVRTFIEQLFEKRNELATPDRHVVWQTFDLAADVKGWQRYSVVQELLDKEPKKPKVARAVARAPARSPMAQINASFARFLKRMRASNPSPLDTAQTARLFRDFLSWPQNPIEVGVPIRLTGASGTGRLIGHFSVKNIEFSLSGRPEYGLLVKPNIEGLQPGTYALDIHDTPSCAASPRTAGSVTRFAAGRRVSAGIGGQSAAVVANVGLGELPDLEVDATGKANQPFIARRLSIADVVNRALVIRAGRDGTARRLACGALR